MITCGLVHPIIITSLDGLDKDGIENCWEDKLDSLQRQFLQCLLSELVTHIEKPEEIPFEDFRKLIYLVQTLTLLSWEQTKETIVEGMLGDSE